MFCRSFHVRMLMRLMLLAVLCWWVPNERAAQAQEVQTPRECMS